MGIFFNILWVSYRDAQITLNSTLSKDLEVDVDPRNSPKRKYWA